MKDIFDTGLKFFLSFVSSPGFFESGVTIASLNWSGGGGGGGGDYTCRKRGINNKRDQRNKVIKALFGDESRDRIKHATFRR